MSKKFKSLIEFLEGPVWNTPIITFIEVRSAVFTDSENDENNESEYQIVFNDYKRLSTAAKMKMSISLRVVILMCCRYCGAVRRHLEDTDVDRAIQLLEDGVRQVEVARRFAVDTMLGCYLEDMNITPEQFEEECKAITDNKILLTAIRKSLFEQVWAAENYEIFKRMMKQKNIELELQALSVLQQALGTTSGKIILDDDEILKEVLKKSEQEHAHHQDQMKKMDDDYQKALKDTLKEAERLDKEFKNSKSMMEKVIKMSLVDNDQKNPEKPEKSLPEKAKKPTAKSAPIKSKSLREVDKRKSYPMVGATNVSLENNENKPALQVDLPSSKKQEIDEKALLLRKKYLCEQRDKLVKQKKFEREKYLNQCDVSKRPKSGRVAKNYMDQKIDAIKSKMDPETLKARKALAACLKEEILHK
ncbi:Cilia- and flagella-associated protein 36 [Nymphon striatum]|nr:Cilia- and flagella-associated protein 36 [Nymphon striatum]